MTSPHYTVRGLLDLYILNGSSQFWESTSFSRICHSVGTSFSRYMRIPARHRMWVTIYHIQLVSTKRSNMSTASLEKTKMMGRNRGKNDTIHNHYKNYTQLHRLYLLHMVTYSYVAYVSICSICNHMCHMKTPPTPGLVYFQPSRVFSYIGLHRTHRRLILCLRHTNMLRGGSS